MRANVRFLFSFGNGCYITVIIYFITFVPFLSEHMTYEYIPLKQVQPAAPNRAAAKLIRKGSRDIAQGRAALIDAREDKRALNRRNERFGASARGAG